MPERERALRLRARTSGLRDYGVVTGAYWAFTLTDGALRMLVLLHLHRNGCSPLEIAGLFLAYEACGVGTNLAAGALGARFGLKRILAAGLLLQIGVCLVLSSQAVALLVPLVIAAQCASGVAKDLVKTSAKSYVRVALPEGESGRLLRLVALLTGSKNTLKGVGFFAGGVALGALGFAGACYAMVGLLGVALVPTLLLLGPRAGREPKQRSWAPGGARSWAPGGARSWAPGGARSWALHDARIRWLSAARLFLFAARDVWFAIALPLFLAGRLGWSHGRVGAFLAVWVIVYGIVQATAPRWIRGAPAAGGLEPPRAPELAGWTGALLVPLIALGAALFAGAPQGLSLVLGLGVFGLIFASCSTLHSYLIVAFAPPGRVARSVGFYYTSNAAGRLLGTAASAALYQGFGGGLDGLLACLGGSSLCVLASVAATAPLAAAERRTESPSLA